MGASIKYLVADPSSGRLSYRRDFPAPLRSYIPGQPRTHKRTLGCTDIGEAQCAERFAEASREYAGLVALARKASSGSYDALDAPTTAYLVAKHRLDLLAADDDVRHGITVDKRSNDARLEWHWANADGFRDKKRANDPELACGAFRADALALGVDAGLRLDPSTPEFRRLCCLLLDDRVEVAEIIVGRDDGVPLPTPQAPVPLVSRVVPPPEVKAPTLDLLIEEYTAEKLAAVGKSTLISYDPVFRLLRGILGGSRLLSTITKDDGKSVFAAVKRLPVNVGKLKQLSGLGIVEAIEEGARLGLPTIEAKTINAGYMAKATALFAYGVSEQYMGMNHLKGRKVTDRVAAKDKRDPFTVQQLNAVFAQAPWVECDRTGGGTPIRFWGPLIALFHGMRLGEIAQLDVSDIVQRNGVDVILIRAGDDGKRVKTANSRRMIPVHPELKRIGLMAFVAAQQKAGSVKLFTGEAHNSREQWGVGFSRWFQRLLASLKVEGSLLGLHSFRHSFQDGLREADLHNTGIGQELAGRSKGGDVSSNYGSGYSTAALAKAMASIVYPGLDLSHLYATEEAG